MSAEPQTYDAFLAYNSEDRVFATEIRGHLQDLGLRIWFDRDDPSERRTIAEQSAALAKSNFFICLKGKYPFGPEQRPEFHIAYQLWRERRGTDNELGITLIKIPDYQFDLAFHNVAGARFDLLDFSKGPTNRQLHALASRVKQDIMAPSRPTATPRQRADDLRIFTLTGGSGAGIGDFCEKLSTRINTSYGAGACGVLSMDRYYTGLPNTRSRVTVREFGADFDHRSMIDLNQLAVDIASLRAGDPIEAPIYDKKTHATIDFELFEPPHLVLLVEGTRVLQNEDLRRLSDGNIHVDVDAEIRFLRRMWKDIGVYDVTPEEAFYYYRQHVKPAYDEIMEYVQKHKSHEVKIDPTDEPVNFRKGTVNLDFGRAVAELSSKLGTL